MMVFLDTVGLLALWDKTDQWHELADVSFNNILAEQSDLVTTQYVLLECGNAAARRPFRLSVIRLRQQLEEVSCLMAPTWQKAWSADERGEADSAGIVDQVSFTVMRRLGLTKAFTNDRHFRAAGFETMF